MEAFWAFWRVLERRISLAFDTFWLGFVERYLLSFFSFVL